MTDVDLSWMNVPGPDGLTFAQKYAGAPRTGLEWMNVRDAEGLTFVERYQQGRLPGQAPVASPAQPGTTEQRNAFAAVQEQLNQFGLGSMADKVWKYVIENGTDDVNRLQLWIYDQPEFKARFPAFEALQKKYRGIQPSEYIQLERQYAQVMRAAGITANYFDDPNDFKSLIENDVSQAEFQQRVEAGFQRVAQADPTVRRAFQRYFGVEGDAALAAFFIDPEKAAPKLMKAAQMAELGGAASTVGVEINADYAERLTRLGVSQQQALAGFQKMQQQRSLFEAGLSDVAVKPSDLQVTSLARDLNGQEELRPAVMPPGWQEGDPLPGGGSGKTAVTDTSTMGEQAQLGTDYIFGTDIKVQRELELRLKKRKATASGTTAQGTVNRQGQTGLGTAD